MNVVPSGVISWVVKYCPRGLGGLDLRAQSAHSYQPSPRYG